MPTRSLMFACALLSAVALAAACGTEDVHPNVIHRDPTSSTNTAIAFFLIRDDAYGPDGDYQPQTTPFNRVRVDGSYLVDGYAGESTYLQANNLSALDLRVAVGSHAVALVDEQGHVVAASPAIETKPFASPPLPSYHPTVVFFGSPSALRARVLIDDPAALPAGAVHLRVMNTFVDHQPLQIVQCLTTIGFDTVPAAGTCTPVGAPLAYGDVFETDAGADVVDTLGFYWAAPGAVDPVVQSIYGVGPSPYIDAGASTSFVTRLPARVKGPGSACPSCLLFGY